MSLEKGSRLGPYEIEALIGEGGMGRVFRARDPRLDRTVALKVLLPGEGSQHRHERFEIEARAVARLGHPHICTLYDVGREGDQVYLVMEYVEGSPLGQGERSGASRVGGSRSGSSLRVSLVRALEYASQIASALSEAHRHGIVHRDLKPANILVGRAGVKLLDFGLAKNYAVVGSDSDVGTRPDLHSSAGSGSEAPTKASLTGRTAIVGTLQYMAPEQIQGRPVDARTDIFALGVILYELIAGVRPFVADSEAGLLAAILERDPPSLVAIRPEAPAGVVRLLDACLAKNPDDRWQSAGDLARELQWILQELKVPADGHAARSRSRWRRALHAALIVAAACMGALLALRWRHAPAEHIAGDPVHFQVPVRGMWRPTAFSMSPDGRVLAYVDEGSDRRNRLFLRRFATGDTGEVPASEMAGESFWSPDSRFLVFGTADALWRVDTHNPGTPTKLVELAGTLKGGTWSADDTILFADRHGVLHRMPAQGGEPAKVFDDKARRIRPVFLPDGQRFLFGLEGAEVPSIWLGSLQGTPPRRMLSARGHALWTDSGHLLFSRGETLVAQRFDPVSAALSGGDIVVATGSETLRPEMFSVSRNGVLAYRMTGHERRRFVWMNRDGQELEQVMSIDTWRGFDLSPDGTKIVAEKMKEGLDLWVLDLKRKVQMLLVANRLPAGNPIWDSTGDFIYYDRWGANVLKKSVAGGEPESLHMPAVNEKVFPEDASRDGKWLATGKLGASQKSHGVVFSLADMKQYTFGEGAEVVDEAHFAPDSRWIAYGAKHQGVFEVYLAPVPPDGQRWQVSSGGGVEARFRADGRELFYLNRDGKLMAVEIDLRGKVPRLEPPRPLFHTGIAYPDGSLDHYAVAADGQRFLVQQTVDNIHATPFQIIVNWSRAAESR